MDAIVSYTKDIKKFLNHAITTSETTSFWGENITVDFLYVCHNVINFSILVQGYLSETAHTLKTQSRKFTYTVVIIILVLRINNNQ